MNYLNFFVIQRYKLSITLVSCNIVEFVRYVTLQKQPASIEETIVVSLEILR